MVEKGPELAGLLCDRWVSETADPWFGRRIGAFFSAPETSFPGNGDRSPQRLGSNGQLSVDTVLMEDLPLIEGDCVRLQQVMLNLINNAVQAMRSVESRKLLMRSSRTDSNEIVFLVSRRSISAKVSVPFPYQRVTRHAANGDGRDGSFHCA